jgi:hypothetical protein
MISRKMPKTSKNTIALSCVYLLIPACAMAKTEKNCCLVESCFILCDNTLHRGTGKSSKHFETTWWIPLRLHDPEFLEVLSSDLLHSAVKGLTNMRSTIKIFGTWKHKNILITKIHWNKKYPDLWFKKMLHRQTSNIKRRCFAEFVASFVIHLLPATSCRAAAAIITCKFANLTGGESRSVDICRYH